MNTKAIMRYIIKEFLGNLFRLFGGLYVIKFAFRKAPFYLVLNYHNFSKYDNYNIKRGSILETDYSENFEKQVRFLKKHFMFLYPEEFFEGEPEKGLNVLITFDDGFKDNFEIAFPILKKHQVKTIFFVVTDIIGKNDWLQNDKIKLLASKSQFWANEIDNSLIKLNKGKALPENIIEEANQHFNTFSLPDFMMSWSDLKEMQAYGFKIMPHTANHPVLSFLNKSDQEQEILSSVRKLSHELQQNPIHFAYPNGLYNSKTIEVLESSEIKYGFTTNRGANTLTEDKLELKRYGLNASDSIAVLLLKLLMTLIRW